MVEPNSILDGRRLEKICQVWRSSGVDGDVFLQGMGLMGAKDVGKNR